MNILKSYYLVLFDYEFSFENKQVFIDIDKDLNVDENIDVWTKELKGNNKNKNVFDNKSKLKMQRFRENNNTLARFVISVGKFTSKNDKKVRRIIKGDSRL
jgi:hypothetical protein